MGPARRADPGRAARGVVNSSQGGGSKDTWVLAGEDQAADAEADRPPLLPATGGGQTHRLDLGNASFDDQQQQQ